MSLLQVDQLIMVDWRMVEGLGGRVRHFRMAKGLTQPQLADLVGLSRWSIANIESNGRGISLEALIRFRNLGADLNWLIANDGTPPAD